jgi:murein L,D-transpeptidase YcbB/YkuD
VKKKSGNIIHLSPFAFVVITGFLFYFGINPGLSEKKTVTKEFGKILLDKQLYYTALVNKFYQERGNQPFWYSGTDEAKQLRQQLISVIDSSVAYGLISRKYHYAELMANVNNPSADSTFMMKSDRIYTDAAIAAMHDVFGYKLSPWVDYDTVTAKSEINEADFIVWSLLAVRSASDLSGLINSMEPYEKDYAALKQELKFQKSKGDKKKINQLIHSMNYYRWIHHFRIGKFIVVNIPSATLRYYEKDSMVLWMKTVVGKPSTPTPRFSAYFDEIILYPYWYVPRSIIFNEFLPKIKKNTSWMDAMNLQVIDGNGKVLNHHSLDWSKFGNGYFPYIMRQCTGCDNALGVIKFNIKNPYGVYLHDTNNKNVFLASSRFFSHGCIRIEKPLELGNYLLQEKLDTAFLQSCFKDQKPIPLSINGSVPVFVVYMTAETDTLGKVRYYKDVYKLLK